MHLPRHLVAPLAGFALLLALLAQAGATPPVRAAQTKPTSTPMAPTPAPALEPTLAAPSLARGTLTKRTYAVMIDNHPKAYPQTGLDHALVVFEALAEFGITRFMAIYVPGVGPDAPAIGPVRSARLYYVQWAMGFGSLYAHAGGSPQGLALAQSTDKIINLDALHRGGGAYFGRSKQRFAPHNLFTSSDDLAKAADKLKVANLDNSELGFLFKPDAAEVERPAAQSLSYYFIYKQDSAGWTYDPATNSYLRLRRGKPARDGASGEQLWTRNVVVIEVQERKIAGDKKGRIEQDVVGSGAGKLFQDGKILDIVWRKQTADAQLRFYAADGQEVQFNTGQIWIVALPALSNLSVK
ncbi:MAG TPA: DUF3048 domain-containing protein [Roseiflexaceae bacterium]|nr:DUF3048 domain-containing protein [Roseiflexaceae bacterium]